MGRVAFAEAQDVSWVSVSPAVDQLIVVSDHAQVPVRAGEQVDECGLRVARVLEFVDDEPLPPLAKPLQPVWVLGEQRDRERQQVVELERVAPSELRLALTPHRRDQRGGRVCRGPFVCLGR